MGFLSEYIEYMKIFRLVLFAFFFGLSAVQLFAQPVTTIPIFPTADDSVTIIYDATQGNGALAGVAPPIYAHTGVITNLSTSLTDWQHVQGVWGTADPNVFMTEIGPDLYRIKYKIRDYYGVPVDETISKMAFVFRNTDGSIVGRDVDGSDIYVDVYPAGLNVAILNPSSDPTIVNMGDNVHIDAASTHSDSLFLYLNDVLVYSTDDSTISYDVTASTPGTTWIKLKGKNATDIKYDSAYYYVVPPVTIADVPAGAHQGINYIDDSTVTLVLYAPYKNYVFAVGDYSDWQLNDDIFMHVTPDHSIYWVTLHGLTPGQEYTYQYFIDGTLWVADPLAEKVLDPWNDPYISASTYPGLIPYPTGKASGYVSVLQTAQPEYVWAVPDFTEPEDVKMVVYELLVRDFTAARNYATLTDTLPYLKALGVNAIELMPIMEFEGNDSWGYNPAFYLAPDKYYGTPDALKTFIDSAHANGMAIILDLAMNDAFGSCPLVQMWWDATLSVPASNNPYFNQYPTHDYNVGYDFNHESEATKNLRNIVYHYWLEKYHADGFRFDLAKGYTQNYTVGDIGAWGAYDASRVAIWQNISDTIRSFKPDAKLILEHFADNSEETVLSNMGFMLWGNMNYNYNEATMGWANTGGNSDLSWGSYKTRGWNDPHLVTYMESHDEERLMYKNITYGNSSNPYHDCKDVNIALERMEEAATFFFPIPGPKMVYEFGELGYDYTIEYNGHTGAKPVKWNYFSDPNRNRLYHIYSALISLKKDYPAFSTTDFSINVHDPLKTIHLNDASMDVTVLGNFQVTDGTITPVFQHTGWWYEYFSGDSIHVTDVNAGILLPPGGYRLYTDERLTSPEIPEIVETISNDNNDISVYPNPSSGNFHFESSLPENISSIGISIYDISGNMIYQDEVHNIFSHFTFDWNATDASGIPVAKGIYICRFSAGDGIVTKKVIVQ